jgi:carbon-monoxide dehydrogenase medium subunit
MKPARFDYVAPGSVEEVVSLLAEHGEEAKIISGGQSLVPMMAFRLATPSVLIDLNGVRELEYVRPGPEALVVGALARQRAVLEVDGLAERCPAVAEGVGFIGHPAIRNRGTVGGSLAHADPSAEWPGLLLAFDGEVDVLGPDGRRTVPASEFLVTYFTTSLRPDEVLVEVRLPIGRGDGAARGSSFVEFAQRHGDFAVAGAVSAMALTGDGRAVDVRLALIGVCDTAVRATSAEELVAGERPTDEVLAEAARAIEGHIDPMSDVHGTSAYRTHVAISVARRALTRARDRALAAGAG